MIKLGHEVDKALQENKFPVTAINVLRDVKNQQHVIEVILGSGLGYNTVNNTRFIPNSLEVSRTLLNFRKQPRLVYQKTPQQTLEPVFDDASLGSPFGNCYEEVQEGWQDNYLAQLTSPESNPNPYLAFHSTSGPILIGAINYPPELCGPELEVFFPMQDDLEPSMKAGDQGDKKESLKEV